MDPKYTIHADTVRISARNPISIWSMEEKKKIIQPHNHQYHEICLVVAGEAVHATEGKKHIVQRGSVLIASPGQIHSFEIQDRFVIFNIFYLAEWVFHNLMTYWEHPNLCFMFADTLLYKRTQVGAVEHLVFNLRQTEELERECGDLAAATRCNPVSHLYLSSTFGKFLAIIGSHGGIHERGMRPEIWQALRTVENIVQSGEPFHPKVLSKNTPVQSAQLARLFRETTGKSPMEFYQHRRAQIAAVRLLNPLLSITQIAMELSYSDAAHFGRIFKRYYQISPREFRLRHRVMSSDN